MKTATVTNPQRPLQLPSVRLDMANLKDAVIRTTYNHNAPDTYEVWLPSAIWAGCETKMVDGLSWEQAKYVRDAFNTALNSGGPFNLKECLRRYDAGF